MAFQRQTFIFLLLGFLLGGSISAQAQGEITVEPTRVEYTIGGQINFETRFPSEEVIQEVWVFAHPIGNPGTIAGAATLHPSNGITYVLDLSEHPIPAYTTIEYWYQITFEDGEILTTASESFFYTDNRFEWQTLNTNPIDVSWYEGDTTFGQEVLNAAQQGIEKLQSFVPAPAPTEISVFVYASATDLQTALRLTGQTGALIAGHANPELGTVVVSIPPGPAQSYEIKRQIPHEIAHVMLFEWLGKDYENLPQWFKEGLPSMAELFPNPDYVQLLNNAYEDENLLPLASLCSSFPLDASNFLLAYAQATDFTWYLYEHHGSSGLEALANAYADGLNCEQGMETALGQTLTEIEVQWRRQTFGENTVSVAIQDFAPWLVILGVVVIAPILLTLGKKRSSTP